MSESTAATPGWKDGAEEFPLRESRAIFAWRLILALLTSGFVAYQAALSYVSGDGMFAYWLAGFVVMAGLSGWNAARVKVISIRDGALCVRTRIGRRGIGAGPVYQIAQIRNLRVAQQRADRRTAGEPVSYTSSHEIVFDYSGRSEVLVTFATEEQAQALLDGPLKKLTST